MIISNLEKKKVSNMYYILYLKIPIKVLIKVGNALKGIYSISCYKSIKKGTKCAVCSGKSKKTLSDYKKHAISKNLKYIFNYIPKSVKEKINGWKCPKGHIIVCIPLIVLL
jgi:hypothetical protein